MNRTVSSRKFPADLTACTGAAAQRWTVTAVPGTPAGAGSWLRNRATGQCLTDPAQPGATFAARPAALTGPCSAATPVPPGSCADRAGRAARQEKWVFGRGSGVPSRVMSTFSL